MSVYGRPRQGLHAQTICVLSNREHTPSATPCWSRSPHRREGKKNTTNLRTIIPDFCTIPVDGKRDVPIWSWGFTCPLLLKFFPVNPPQLFDLRFWYFQPDLRHQAMKQMMWIEERDVSHLIATLCILHRNRNVRIILSLDHYIWITCKQTVHQENGESRIWLSHPHEITNNEKCLAFMPAKYPAPTCMLAANPGYSLCLLGVAPNAERLGDTALCNPSRHKCVQPRTQPHNTHTHIYIYL